MDFRNQMELAQTVLGIHLIFVGFIAFGLIAIPIGARLGWEFVSIFWWRALHLAAIAIVALQKFAGKLCFLTTWEFGLLRTSGHSDADMQPLFAFGSRLIHWNMPLWFFSALYALTLLYVCWLWWCFPPSRATTRYAQSARSPR
ncbi:MAG: DUF2784 domain-containing protein [Candidatus Eremiobacteraeota bacterium]|nr:DUF2784 domain-containing protein [Candidatus Eremiobacteraeota bacterium]MBV8367202.1 DUF2784 domain-containing protein [Candidatus Eremiobacteraeota bacterium]